MQPRANLFDCAELFQLEACLSCRNSRTSALFDANFPGMGTALLDATQVPNQGFSAPHTRVLQLPLRILRCIQPKRWYKRPLFNFSLHRDDVDPACCIPTNLCTPHYVHNGYTCAFFKFVGVAMRLQQINASSHSLRSRWVHGPCACPQKWRNHVVLHTGIRKEVGSMHFTTASLVFLVLWYFGRQSSKEKLWYKRAVLDAACSLPHPTIVQYLDGTIRIRVVVSEARTTPISSKCLLPRYTQQWQRITKGKTHRVQEADLNLLANTRGY